MVPSVQTPTSTTRSSRSCRYSTSVTSASSVDRPATRRSACRSSSSSSPVVTSPRDDGVDVLVRHQRSFLARSRPPALSEFARWPVGAGDLLLLPRLCRALRWLFQPLVPLCALAAIRSWHARPPDAPAYAGPAPPMPRPVVRPGRRRWPLPPGSGLTSAAISGRPRVIRVASARLDPAGDDSPGPAGRMRRRQRGRRNDGGPPW